MAQSVPERPESVVPGRLGVQVRAANGEGDRPLERGLLQRPEQPEQSDYSGLGRAVERAEFGQSVSGDAAFLTAQLVADSTGCWRRRFGHIIVGTCAASILKTGTSASRTTATGISSATSRALPARTRRHAIR